MKFKMLLQHALGRNGRPGFSGFGKPKFYFTPPRLGRIGLFLMGVMMWVWGYGQTYHCGTFEKNPNVPVWYSAPENPNLSYFDRFGNEFSHDEINLAKNPKLSQLGCSGTGFFNIYTDGSFTANEETSICAVFGYLSSLITAQVPSAKVNIKITKGIITDPSTGQPSSTIYGTGSPFWSKAECGIANSNVLEGLTGGAPSFGIEHGEIRINAQISNWHTHPVPGGTQASNAVDLYSVVLHEALHVMGFASNIARANGQIVPANDNFFTRYDSYLFSENDDASLLIADQSNPACCDAKEINPTVVQTLLALGTPNNCNGNIKFKAVGPAINLETYSTIPGASLPNMLSHFSESCNSGQFVMTDGIFPGENRRTLNPSEVDVLCHLGYQTGGCGAAACNVIARDDQFVMTAGETLTLDVVQLTVNDIGVEGLGLSQINAILTPVPGCGNLSVQNEAVFSITLATPGEYSFCYRLDNCGQCDEATVHIYVLSPYFETCCDNLDCGLLCPGAGSFERYESQAELRLRLCKGVGTPDAITFSNSSLEPDNTPDFFPYYGPDLPFTCVQGETVPLTNVHNAGKFVAIQVRNLYPEGFALPLCHVFESGKTAKLKFRAASFLACSGVHPSVRIDFTQHAPSSGQNIYNPVLGPVYEAPPFQNTPNGNPPAPIIPVIPGSSPGNVVFYPFEIEITNDFGVDVNTLILSSSYFNDSGALIPIGYILLDDIEFFLLPEDKPLADIIQVQSEVEPNFPCIGGLVDITYEICNQTDQYSPSMDFSIQLPTGLSHVPTPDFPDLQVNIPGGWLAPGPNICKTMVLRVQVNNDAALIGQTLEIPSLLSAGCYTPLEHKASMEVQTQHLSIEKNVVVNPVNQNLEFTITVRNDFGQAIGPVEVEDIVSSSMNIINPGNFTSIGSLLKSSVASIPAFGEVMLSFSTSIKNGESCKCVQNCVVARMAGGNCGEVYDCVDIPGFSTEANSGFSFVQDVDICKKFNFVPESGKVCDQHLWYFGDGSSSTEANPSHFYQTLGAYTISHKVSNECGSEITEASLLVDCDNVSKCPCDPHGLTFDATSESPLYDASLGGVPYSAFEAFFNFDQNNDAILDMSEHQGCISIAGRLVIDQNISINGCGNMRMHAGAEIQVLGPNVLKLQGNRIYSCDRMWRGITIKPGATLISEAAGAIMNKIEDAQYAITAENQSSLKVVQTIFDDNFIGIRTPQTLVVKTINLIGDGISNNTFTSTDGMSQAYIGQTPNPGVGTAPYAAFQLNTVSGINIGGAGTNWIQKHKNGVIAIKSAFSAQHANILGILNSGFGTVGIIANSCPYAQIEDCNISSFKTAISASATNTTIDGGEIVGISDPAMLDIGIHIDHAGNRITQVQNEHIAGTSTGIEILNALNGVESFVDNNQIDGFSVPPNSPAQVYAGLSMVSCSGFLIRDNHIGDGTTGGLHRGIYLNDCSENTFYANTMYTMQKGIEVMGGEFNAFNENVVTADSQSPQLLGKDGFVVNGSSNFFCHNSANRLTGIGFDFFGDCQLTEIKTSQIYKSGIGLHISAIDSKIGIQDNFKNKWWGPFSSGYGAFHESSSLGEIQLSQFRTQNPLIPIWNTNAGNGPGVDWFKEVQEDHAEITCPVPVRGEGGGEARLGTLDDVTAQGAFQGYYPDATNWTGQVDLLSRIRKHPSIVGSGQHLHDFYANNQEGPIAFQSDFRSQLRAFSNRGLEQGSMMEARALQIQYWYDHLIGLEASSLPDGLSISQTKATLRALTEAYLASVNYDAYKQRAEAGHLMDLTAMLPEDGLFKSNEKEIAQIFLAHKLWEAGSEPSESVWTAIQDIAGQCGISGGKGVYYARAIATAFGRGANWEDNDLCVPLEQREKGLTALSAKKWIAIPNPASTSISLIASRPVTQTCRVFLMNTAGAVVYDAEIAAGDSSIGISVENLPSGLYFYAICGDDADRINGKISIQH